MKKAIFISIFSLVSVFGISQNLSNIRSVKVAFSDTVKLDSLSLVPNSVKVYANDIQLDSAVYSVDIAKARLLFFERFTDSLFVIYRVLPYNLDKEVAKYRIDTTQILNSGFINPYTFSAYQEPGIVKGFSGIDKRGSISRGISFGNNQDVVVNSDLNLQLNGKLSEKVKILAAVTDRNIPIQAEGNTQQLQEFDRIFVKIYSDSLSLLAGDFVLDRPKGYFLNYYKRGQGVSFDGIVKPFKSDTNSILKTNVSAAIAKGRFARNNIQGVEANQGPYRLAGTNNEQFIIVLSGTERVYINGKQLTRGQNNDYIINYNTAEITFMPKQLITKDSRIAVEFEYSDKNYTRTMLATSNDLKYKKMNFRFNYLSEQDSKNQPLLQDLTTEQKALLSTIGDTLSKAIVPNVDSVAFNNNEVLYQKKDTLGTQIFVYSTNSDSALFRVSFSQLTGGSYIQSSTVANGKVFTFVGAGKGTHEPVIQLVTPKKQQMVTFGTDYIFNKTTNVTFEYALSGNDINTFSRENTSDDFDKAVKFKFNNTHKLRRDWQLKSKLDYEHTGKNFTTFKRFRAVEFSRNWNLGNATNSEIANLTNAELQFSKSKLGTIKYSLQNFNKSNSYAGLKNNVDVSLTKNNYELKVNGSYLKSDNSVDVLQSDFYRANSELSKRFDRLKLGLTSKFEDNQFNKTDTLQLGSYRFIELGGYIANADSAKNLYKLTFTNRAEDSLKTSEQQLSDFVFTDNLALDYTFRKNPKSILKLNATYRNSNNVHQKESDESVLGRTEYNLNLYKGLLRSTTFYQFGSGREIGREIRYVQVSAGQGTHVWVDRDNDNEKDLDEFEVGLYPDQRDHIRVFVQTNTFIKVFNNEFNQSLFLRSNPKWRKEKGLKKLVSKLSLQSVYRITRKTNKIDLNQSLNPFEQIADSSLQAITSQHRHMLFVNRSNSKFGFDIGFQKNANKSLLNGGFEERNNAFFEFKNRTAITKKLLFRLESKLGDKANKSQLFSTRNYSIAFTTVEPKFTYQPSLNFQSTLSFDYTNKQNTDSVEIADLATVKIEARYNVAATSRLTFNFDYVNISYNQSDQNSPVAFEMLQSLRTGNNVVWKLAYTKQFKNKIQLTINYDGRKSENVNTVHTGNMQVRAFF